MEIAVSTEQGSVPVAVLHLKGELTREELLESEARKAFDAGARYMLLDLTDVAYISSAGLRGIHKVYKMLREGSPGASDQEVSRGLADGTYKSSHLKLLKPSKNALRALSVAGFDMFLEIHDRRKEAIASFGATQSAK
jgi:hypothetical protein